MLFLPTLFLFFLNLCLQLFVMIKLYNPGTKFTTFISFLPQIHMECTSHLQISSTFFVVAVSNMKQKTAIREILSHTPTGHWHLVHTQADVTVKATHQKDSYAMDNKSSQLSKLNHSISTGTKLLLKHSWYSVWLPAFAQNKGRTVFTLPYLCFLSVFWNKSCSSTWVLFSVRKVIWGVW